VIDKDELTTAELTAAILRTVAKESERERRELGVDHNPVCSDCAALRGKVEQLERAILRYAHIEESLASTVRGLEFELEKANKQIDGLYAELASTGAEEVRQTRAENHQISQKASKLCYDLIARERELEKANAALDLLNTHCMSADPIMGRSTYRWTIEHDEPDIRAAIAELRKAQV
jgi:hypothetical protein